MLVCLVFVLGVDGAVLAVDFYRGGYISKMREKIDEERLDSNSEFTGTLKISENMTEKKD